MIEPHFGKKTYCWEGVGAKGQIGSLSYHLFVEAPVWQTDRLLANSMSSSLQMKFHY